MTIFDLQEKYKNDHKGLRDAIGKMSHEEITQIIDSCGTPQGKSAMKKSWEAITGKKY